MPDTPGPLLPTQTTTIKSCGLYAETFVPAGDIRGSVLVTHGYMEHCGRYRELAHVIVRAGWAELAYDVRGHGRSPGARGAIDRFATYLDDLQAAADAARALAPGRPMVLLGHSHGSLITLRALCDGTVGAVRAIVSSPYLALKLAVPGYKKLAARALSRVAPELALREKLRVEDLTSDPAKQRERLADTLCFDLATPRWFTEVTAAQAHVAAHASRIALPTTWLVGADDRICDAETSRRVAATVPGADYHSLSGMMHEVFNERDRASVFADVTKALAASV
jgi:alpha-beta hydrolase superfamily lysophospholipase